MRYEPGMIEADGRLALEGPATRRRGRRIAIVAALVALALLLGWWWHARHAAPVAAGKRAEQAPSVTVIQPGRRTVDRTLSATGSLAARVDMPVGIAGEGGRVTDVLVQPGDWVHAGQVLAVVDRSVQTQTAASLGAQVSVAEADAKLAQAQLERAQQLVGRGFISKADIDTRTATRDAANARVAVARAQLGQQRATNGRLDIRAPAEGLVLTRQVEPGQVVSGGTGTLFRLAKGGEMEMRALLAESDLAALHVGAAAEVTPVGSQQAFHGSVWQVAPVIDPTTRQGIARVALKFDPALRPGGFAAARLTAGASTVPQLPQSAIQSDDKGNYVLILGPGDRVQRRGVTLGEVSDAGVAVTGGLTGQEKVVASAGAFLNAGQKVAPILQKAS